MVRDVFEDDQTPVKSVIDESAGYSNCVGCASWIWSCPKPAMETISELPPPAQVKHMPTERGGGREWEVRERGARSPMLG